MIAGIIITTVIGITAIWLAIRLWAARKTTAFMAAALQHFATEANRLQRVVLAVRSGLNDMHVAACRQDIDTMLKAMVETIGKMEDANDPA